MSRSGAETIYTRYQHSKGLAGIELVGSVIGQGSLHACRNVESLLLGETVLVLLWNSSGRKHYIYFLPSSTRCDPYIVTRGYSSVAYYAPGKLDSVKLFSEWICIVT